MESLIQTPNIWVLFRSPFVANIFNIIFNLRFLHKIGNKDFRGESSFATFTQIEHLPAIIWVYGKNQLTKYIKFDWFIHSNNVKANNDYAEKTRYIL